MKRTLLVFSSLFVAAAMSGMVTISACRGGVDGYGDAGRDGDIIGMLGRGSASSANDACAAATGTDDDAGHGGAGCPEEEDSGE